MVPAKLYGQVQGLDLGAMSVNQCLEFQGGWSELLNQQCWVCHVALVGFSACRLELPSLPWDEMVGCPSEWLHLEVGKLL